MPSLKSSFSSELKSKVVYRLELCGCKSIYVSQTIRRLTKRIEEHRKKDNPVEKQIELCGSDSGKSQFIWKKIDQAPTSINLLTLRRCKIGKKRPAINTRDEFRIRS